MKNYDDSILNDVKKSLGMTPEYDAFDNDLILHINTVFSTYRQMGIGPQDGFSIQDENATWQDYLGDRLALLEQVKTCTCLKVRLLFDPPSSSVHLDSMNKIIAELEYRMYIEEGGY